MPPKGCTRAGILPGCPGLCRGSREAKVGFEPRTFGSHVLHCRTGTRGGQLPERPHLDRRTIRVFNQSLWLISLTARQWCLAGNTDYQITISTEQVATCSNPQPAGPGDCVRQTSNH
ncbi:hypothetical protein T265_08705 [Opisthorchis viverrini]|uniref:Uncharacterized protein n=1 Tax=Opisthorchis viverrini TaxID=6198 RepID=A0A075A7E7_OPIVI|nr:hypothetical protein T265_08705 [Opisthorchis viverrini]KER23379.1 hypothetical protein T265_08705 [Opisthorchis viverrini]